MQCVQSGTPVLLTESGTISKASGTLIGFYVNSTNAGTIQILTGADGTSSGTAIGGSITPSIGWRAYPAYCPSGAYATIGGTALNVTLFFAAG